MCSINTIVVLLTFSILLGTCLGGEEWEWDSKPALNSESVFERFLERYLETLSKSLTGKALIRYCKMLSKELEKIEFSQAERLAVHFAYLSRLSRDSIADEMIRYRREFDEKLPKQEAFLTSLSEAFNAQHDVIFDDYIDDLSKYADGDLLFITIQEQTRLLLTMIVNCIRKLDRKKRRELEKEMRLAIREYKNKD